MSIETLLIIGFCCLLVITIIQSIQISKLDRDLEHNTKRLENRVEKWLVDRLENKVNRHEEKHEIMMKSVSDIDKRLFENMLSIRNDLSGNIKTTQDQIHAFADKMGYTIDKKPVQFQVSAKVPKNAG